MNAMINDIQAAIFYRGSLVGDTWDEAGLIELRKAAVDAIIECGGIVPAVCAAIFDEGEVRGPLYYYNDDDARYSVRRLADRYRFDGGSTAHPVRKRATTWDRVGDFAPYELARISNW